MDPLTVLTLISTAVQVAGSVKGLLDQGGVTKQSLQTTVPQIIPQLAEIGAALFPKVPAEMQLVAAASATFDPNVTKWLQTALNKLLTPSRISLWTVSMGQRHGRPSRPSRRNWASPLMAGLARSRRAHSDSAVEALSPHSPDNALSFGAPCARAAEVAIATNRLRLGSSRACLDAHQACVRCSPIERCYVGSSKGKRD